VDRKLNPNFSLFESLNDKKSLSKTKYDAIMHLNKNKNKNVIQLLIILQIIRDLPNISQRNGLLSMVLHGKRGSYV